MLLSAVVLHNYCLFPGLMNSSCHLLASQLTKRYFATGIATPLLISLSLFPPVTCKFQWLISLLFQTLNFQICIFHPPVHNLFYILLCFPFIILEFYSWEKPSSCYSALEHLCFTISQTQTLSFWRWIIWSIPMSPYIKGVCTGVLQHKLLSASYWDTQRAAWLPALSSGDGGISVARFPLSLDGEMNPNGTVSVNGNSMGMAGELPHGVLPSSHRFEVQVSSRKAESLCSPFQEWHPIVTTTVEENFECRISIYFFKPSEGCWTNFQAV